MQHVEEPFVSESLIRVSSSTEDVGAKAKNNIAYKAHGQLKGMLIFMNKSKLNMRNMHEMLTLNFISLGYQKA